MSILNILNSGPERMVPHLDATKSNTGILIIPRSEEFNKLVVDGRVFAILSTTINWCRFILCLVPLTIEDSKYSFYHSINISIGIKNSKQLFRNFLQHLQRLMNSESLQYFQFFSRIEFELNEEQIRQKWDSLNVDSVTDFHIFLMAHMCERPIIVAEKNNSAIYLPILIQKRRILNNPILLAASNGKYSPLVFTSDESQDPYKSALLPLADHNYNVFRMPFISESDYLNTLKEHLFLTYVLNTNNEGINMIYAVKMRKPRMVENANHGTFEVFQQIHRYLQEGNCEEAINLHKEKIVKNGSGIIDMKSPISPNLVEMDNDIEETENLYEQAPDIETINQQKNFVSKSFNDQTPSLGDDNEVNDSDSLLEGEFVSSIVNSDHAMNTEEQLLSDNEELSSNPLVVYTTDGSTLPKQQSPSVAIASSQNQHNQEDVTKVSSHLDSTHQSQTQNSSADVVDDAPNNTAANPFNQTESFDNLNEDTTNSLNEDLNQRNSQQENYENGQPNSYVSDLSHTMERNNESSSSASDLRSFQSNESNDFSSLTRSVPKFPAGAEIVVRARNHIVVTGVSNATAEQPIGLFLRESHRGRTAKAFVRISKRSIPEIFVNIHGKVETNYSRTDEDKVTMSLHFVSDDTAVFVGIVPKVYQIKTNRNEKNVAPASSYSSAFRHTEDHDEDNTATIQNNPLKCKIDGCNRLGVPHNRGLCDNCVKDWKETQARRGLETPSGDAMCMNYRCNNMGSNRFHGYCESCFNTRP